jgi:hypothetical protein
MEKVVVGLMMMSFWYFDVRFWLRIDDEIWDFGMRF